MTLRRFAALALFLSSATASAYPFYVQFHNNRDYDLVITDGVTTSIVPTGKSLTMYFFHQPQGWTLEYHSSVAKLLSVDYKESLDALFDKLKIANVGRKKGVAREFVIELTKPASFRYEATIKETNRIHDNRDPQSRLGPSSAHRLPRLELVGSPAADDTAAADAAAAAASATTGK